MVNVLLYIIASANWLMCSLLSLLLLQLSVAPIGVLQLLAHQSSECQKFLGCSVHYEGHRQCVSHVDRVGFAKESRSQRGEDIMLFDGLFNKVCHGTFVELGALDGIRFSNTFAFAKLMGWSGLLIEASPGRFEELTQKIGRAHV